MRGFRTLLIAFALAGPIATRGATWPTLAAAVQRTNISWRLEAPDTNTEPDSDGKGGRYCGISSE